MKVAYCPYCNNLTLIDEADWGRLAQCEGPRCEKFFPTSHLVRASSSGSQIPAGNDPLGQVAPSDLAPSQPHDTPCRPPAESAPFDGARNQEATRPNPRLTAPHRCQQCAGEIPLPFGKRRTTVLHQDPDRNDNCRTDIYAVLFHCPGCATFLEMPSWQSGTDVTCPSCSATFAGPHDILHRHSGDAREGVAFSFACPSCQGELLADSSRAGVSTAGLAVACPQCRDVILVPAGGSQVNPAPHILDPIEAVRLAPLRRCPTCNTPVPADSPCPMCRPVTL